LVFSYPLSQKRANKIGEKGKTSNYPDFAEAKGTCWRRRWGEKKKRNAQGNSPIRQGGDRKEGVGRAGREKRSVLGERKRGGNEDFGAISRRKRIEGSRNKEKELRCSCFSVGRKRGKRRGGGFLHIVVAGKKKRKELEENRQKKGPDHVERGDPKKREKKGFGPKDAFHPRDAEEKKGEPSQPLEREKENDRNSPGM